MQRFTISSFLSLMFWALVFGWIISSGMMYYIAINDRRGFWVTAAVSVVMLVKLIHGSDFFKRREASSKHSVLADQDILVRQ